MDRRILKTRRAIMQAFYRLLDQKKYENITIQDIIDEADIGRSTFYSHFETKDELIHSMCRELFEHVFSDDKDAFIDFEMTEGQDRIIYRIHHICTHLYENRNEIVRLMRFESSIIYKQYLREYLEELFTDKMHIKEHDIPESFIMKQLVDSFISALEWWAHEGMETPPSDFAGYYCEMYTRIFS